MNCKDLSGEMPLIEPVRLPRILPDGTEEISVKNAVHEHTMLLYLQEEPVMQITCTPQYLCELVLGRLLTGGVIRGTDEVDGLYICTALLYSPRSKSSAAEAPPASAFISSILFLQIRICIPAANGSSAFSSASVFLRAACMPRCSRISSSCENFESLKSYSS